MKKGRGQLIHVLDFVEEENGRLIVRDQSGAVVKDAHYITYCYDPPQFFSSIPVAPATAPPAAHAPAPPPAVQPIPVQPVAPPQQYIRT